MAWFKKDRSGQMIQMEGDRPNSDLSDIEFNPSKLKEELTSTFTAQMQAFQEQQAAANKPLLDMAAAIQAERAERAENNRRAAASKTAEEDSVSAEDFMLDPEAATKRAMQPIARSTMMLAAKMARQETLADSDYYHGDVKTKTDGLIASLPLNQQSNPASIMNCYKIACFDAQKDIADGKLKSKNAAVVFEGGSTGAHSGSSNGEGNETLTADEKQAAAAFGMSEKEWSKSRREMVYV
jgi:hypothetical protein